MRVMLLYEHISREGEEIKRIAQFLRQRNVEVSIFSILFQYGSILCEVQKHKYDAVVFPWMHHDKNYELAAPFIKKNPDVILINLSHEEIGTEYSSPALIPHGYNAKNSVLHFVWGEYFAEFLEKNGVQKNLILITGNGRTDFIYNARFTRESLAEKYNLSLKKKWILFSENRGAALNWSKKQDDEAVRNGIAQKDTDEYISLIKTSLYETEKDFSKLNDEFFKNYELIYRPHPGTKPIGKMDNRIKVISDYSIYDWLAVVTANVVWSSTTIFESDAMGIPSIIYEPIENPAKFRTFGTDEYLKIQSIIEITDKTIENALKHQEDQKKYLQYLGDVNGNCCNKIADEIINCILNRPDGYRAAKCKIGFAYKTKLVMMQLVTFVFSKLNLVQRLKYPHTAFLEYKDIPWLFGEHLQ